MKLRRGKVKIDMAALEEYAVASWALEQAQERFDKATVKLNSQIEAEMTPEEFDFVSGSVIKLKVDSDFAELDPVYLHDGGVVRNSGGDFIGRAVKDAKAGQMVDVVIFRRT